jgi:hypothetical protein
VFGGESDQNIPLKELLYLDIDTMNWVQPSVKGLEISNKSIVKDQNDKEDAGSDKILLYPRIAASSVIYKNHAFIFGGFDGINWYNDVYAIDLDTHRWKFVKTKEKIEPRCRHTSVIRENDGTAEMVVFGGNDAKSNFNEVLTIKLPSNMDTAKEQALAQPQFVKTECSENNCEITKALSDMSKDDKYSDIVFKVKDEYFPAHSVI